MYLAAAVSTQNERFSQMGEVIDGSYQGWGDGNGPASEYNGRDCLREVKNSQKVHCWSDWLYIFIHVWHSKQYQR